MADLRDKLGALMKKQGLMTGAQWVRQREQVNVDRAAGRFDLERIVPGEVVGEGEDGLGFYRIRHDFPPDTIHGNLTLGALLEAQTCHVAFSACDEELADFDPRRTLFMDTETIGLAGGAGTVAFLIGAGYFLDDGVFRLDQCFMRDYDDEEPMLAYLAELFTGRETVVGYNSKSFDLPLMRTRFIQNRIPFRLDGFAHYDLMHAARRFWKVRLGSCTLQNVEKEILGLHRTGDVPSHLIPQFWFDYLRTRDARPLKGVFYHHQMDILSLVALAGHVCQVLDVPNGGGFDHAEDRLSLVRVYYRQKKYADVLTQANGFIEREDRSPLRRECLEMLASAQKRLGEFAAMAETLQLLVEEFPSNITARLELAKHHEHRTRNLERAEALVRDALDLLDTRASLGRDLGLAAGAHAEVRNRLARIEKKRRKYGGLDLE
jgi:uncharacterized protein YprB with RNaseH-like and TPR domain